ncbi:MAG TPA: M28 family peptidase [Casimicrobium sp.]|nr:M28 family peptidase [Casimicrobium sp.]
MKLWRGWIVYALTALLAAATIAAWLVVQPTWTRAGASAAPPALPAALRKHVHRLAVDFAPRVHTNLTQLNNASAYIEAELRSTTATVSVQSYTVTGRGFQNLIAQFGPDTEDVIVVGAHYDVADIQPGADDNASGVAGLIELAKALSNAKLKQRVELVAYTLEEPPYFRTANMGSAVHAKSLKANGKRVSLMLSLECIGYFSDEPYSQQLLTPLMKAVYPTTGNFIALVGNYAEGDLSRRVKRSMQQATSLPVYSINAPSVLQGIDFSDHLSYWNEGFVGMMVTDTAFFRNEAYHTEDDTPDRLDYKRMAEVVVAVTQTILSEARR